MIKLSIYILLKAIFVLLVFKTKKLAMANTCQKSLLYFRTELVEKNNMSFFSNFAQFSDLELDCDQKYETTSKIQFLPNRNIMLDSRLAIDKLFKLDDIRNIVFILVSNLKGIDLNSRRMIEIDDGTIKKSTELVLIFSKFDIYSN